MFCFCSHMGKQSIPWSDSYMYWGAVWYWGILHLQKRKNVTPGCSDLRSICSRRRTFLKKQEYMYFCCLFRGMLRCLYFVTVRVICFRRQSQIVVIIVDTPAALVVFLWVSFIPEAWRFHNYSVLIQGKPGKKQYHVSTLALLQRTKHCTELLKLTTEMEREWVAYWFHHFEYTMQILYGWSLVRRKVTRHITRLQNICICGYKCFVLCSLSIIVLKMSAWQLKTCSLMLVHVHVYTCINMPVKPDIHVVQLH